MLTLVLKDQWHLLLGIPLLMHRMNRKMARAGELFVFWDIHLSESLWLLGVGAFWFRFHRYRRWA